jgi:hypothetical protein
MRIPYEPKQFTNEEKKMRYIVNRLASIVLDHIQRYMDGKDGNLLHDSLEKLFDLLQIGFGDEDIQATAPRQLLKLKMYN